MHFLSSSFFFLPINSCWGLGERCRYKNTLIIGDIQGNRTILCNNNGGHITLQICQDHRIYNLKNDSLCTLGTLVNVMHQYLFINYIKYTTLLWNVNKGHYKEQRREHSIWEHSTFSAQFFYKSKTVFTNKIY